jgi:hypothetical protein
MSSSEKGVVKNLVETLINAKNVVLPPEILLERVDAVTINGFITLYDLGELIDNLPCNISRLNDSMRLLEKTLELFDVRTELRFPPPKKRENSAYGYPSVSRADLAVFLLRMEACGAPINPESLALSVAGEALKKGRISQPELDCVFYARGQLSFTAFERGYDMGEGTSELRTLKTATGRKVYVEEGPKRYWVRIPSKRLRPSTLTKGRKNSASTRSSPGVGVTLS